MVTLKTFDTAIDAHILKSRLENEGIPAYIFDENIVTLNPLYTNLVGGIKLRISESDLARAEKILTTLDTAEIVDDHGTRIACPRCGSVNLYSGFKTVRGIKGVVSFIISLLFVVYPLYYNSVKKCRDCEFEF